MDALARIREAANRVVAAHGLDLFDVELTRESQGWVVRVTIDRPGPAATPEDSVSIEDCSTVSRELSAILDGYCAAQPRHAAEGRDAGIHDLLRAGPDLALEPRERRCPRIVRRQIAHVLEQQQPIRIADELRSRRSVEGA